MPRPIAFFITWTTYGTWLQGDDRGSILGRGGKQPQMIAPRRGLAQANHKGLKHEPVLFSESQRRIVEDTIRSHCDFKSWRLHAVAVRTNHVHVVVSGDVPPERMLREFKAWSTRRLREQREVGADTTVWTRHGSTRYLNTSEAIDGAIKYVRDGQGAPLSG